MDRADFLKLMLLMPVAAVLKPKSDPLIVYAACDVKSAYTYYLTQHGLGFRVSKEIIENDLYGSVRRIPFKYLTNKNAWFLV